MAVLGYRAEIDAGRRFLEDIEPDDTIVLLFHGDADGLCAGQIMFRTLQFMGAEMTFPAFMEKGESVYSQSLANRVLARSPTRLIVMDTGSRPLPIVPGVTSMVIDHHRPEGVPPVDLFLTSFGVEPEATAALLTHEICKDMVHVGGLDWLAAIGVAGDLGVGANIEVLKAARKLYGVSAIKEATALINAARRAPAHDVATAFDALTTAASPLDIAEGAVSQVALLRQYREQVNSELRRARRTAPVIKEQWALLQFSSPALVHSIAAVSWTRRLADNIVIAANYGYTEGNVHFSLRSAKDINLIDELRRVREVRPDAEFGHGHPRATGGILPIGDFQEFLRALGFPDDVAGRIPQEQGTRS